jgi:hypothetical protein
VQLRGEELHLRHGAQHGLAVALLAASASGTLFTEEFTFVGML